MHEEKDALIRALWAQVQAQTAQVQTLVARVAELEARLGASPRTPDNSSLPPSKGKKPNRPEKGKRHGPRPGSLGRIGGGRALTATPDEIVGAKPVRCAHCQAAFGEADQVLHGRYDKIDLPPVVPVVTRVERYTGRCRCCGGTTLAPVPEGLEPGTPFSVGIVALAMYLRFVHAISYQRLSRLLGELFGLAISEGALDAAFRRGKPAFDADVAAILARLRRARVVCSDETSVRIDGSESPAARKRTVAACTQCCGRGGRCSKPLIQQGPAEIRWAETLVLHAVSPPALDSPFAAWQYAGRSNDIAVIPPSIPWFHAANGQSGPGLEWNWRFWVEITGILSVFSFLAVRFRRRGPSTP